MNAVKIVLDDCYVEIEKELFHHRTTSGPSQSQITNISSSSQVPAIVKLQNEIMALKFIGALEEQIQQPIVLMWYQLEDITKNLQRKRHDATKWRMNSLTKSTREKLMSKKDPRGPNEN